jgi:L-ascorbate metabolism protein UlaG (beta-lactamase superfamily)
MGSVLDLHQAGRHVLRLYITGDTLFHDRLAEIPERLPGIDVCLIHLGGTRVAGILLTMDGAQGVRALQVVRPRAAVPIHFDDYPVFKSPLSDFRAAVASASPHLETEIRYVDRGDTVALPLRSSPA